MVARLSQVVSCSMFLTTAGDIIDQLIRFCYKLSLFELAHYEGRPGVRGDLLRALFPSLHLLRFVVREILLLLHLVSAVMNS